MNKDVNKEVGKQMMERGGKQMITQTYEGVNEQINKSAKG